MPTFAKINDNELFMVEQRFGEVQIDALRDFMVQSAQPKHKYGTNEIETVLTENILKTITIDNCALKDSDFAKILEGLIAQQEVECINYLNNGIGKDSVEKLAHILNHEKSGIFLKELRLVNL